MKTIKKVPLERKEEIINNRPDWKSPAYGITKAQIEYIRSHDHIFDFDVYTSIRNKYSVKRIEDLSRFQASLVIDHINGEFGNDFRQLRDFAVMDGTRPVGNETLDGEDKIEF